MTTDLKALTRLVPDEILNKGRLELSPQVFSEDYLEHAQLPSDWPKGIPGFNRYVQHLRAAFPDFHCTVDDLIAEGDTVVCRLSASGTHQGEFLGIPATGKHATWGEIHLCKFANGKLVEHWVNVDQLGMMQQLGVIPSQ